MAATFAEKVESGWKPSTPLVVTKVQITCDNSYPDGGYDFSGQISDDLTLLGGLNVVLSDGHYGVVDRTNKKLKIGKFADTTEVWTQLTAGANLTGVTGEIVLFQY